MTGSPIPEIDPRRLERLAKRIRPVDGTRGAVRLYPRGDPRGHAFLWNGATGKRTTVSGLVGEPVRTLHRFDAPAFFKPSLAEVFAQMPEGVEERANAFHVRYVEPETIRSEETGEAETFHVGEVQYLIVA
jgi:hypothetical protein